MARAKAPRKTAGGAETSTDPAPRAKKRKAAGGVETKLVGMADVVIAAAQRSKDPTFAIPIRALSNVSFNPRKGMIEMGRKKQERTFFNVGMAKKFMQTMLVADALAELQRADLTTSLREIYYRAKHTIKDSQENTFDTQDESDPIIEDLEVSLAELREELHVRAENAGSIVGPLVLVDDGDQVDCARLGKGGYSVPSIVEPARQAAHPAGRLAAAVEQHAIGLLPELILGEAVPLRALLDEQDEIGGALQDLHVLGLDDRGDRVAALAEPRAVHAVAVVAEHHRADDAASVLGPDVQLLAQLGE